ncbi:hypothetical protein DI53_2886 [Sphingobacterium deserti]|uniref:Uncharacterized protein n=1 Tax=Sphingobacterium deserti TaxID=1229276 RepID=A0A0B8T726_9SPHI|nr:hypothetical protein DI53_2886 [Sphingobacterium deserti]
MFCRSILIFGHNEISVIDKQKHQEMLFVLQQANSDEKQAERSWLME